MLADHFMERAEARSAKSQVSRRNKNQRGAAQIK